MNSSKTQREAAAQKQQKPGKVDEATTSNAAANSARRRLNPQGFEELPRSLLQYSGASTKRFNLSLKRKRSADVSVSEASATGTASTTIQSSTANIEIVETQAPPRKYSSACDYLLRRKLQMMNYKELMEKVLDQLHSPHDSPSAPDNQQAE